MTTHWTFLLSLAMTAVTVLFVAALVVTQLRRRWGDRRRTRLGAPARRLLLELAAGEDDAAERLVALPERIWRAAEPTAVALLAKIRGDARGLLIEVFERRGVAKDARRQVRRHGVVRRANAAALLGALRRREAVPDLCTLLTDFDPEVRVVAARSLGRIGDPSAVPALLRSVDLRMGPPHQVVAHALLDLGTPAERSLLDLLAEVGPGGRATVVEVLGLARTRRALPAIIDVLWRDPEREVRVRAVRALGRIGGRAALGPVLDMVAPGRPTVLRAVAARALGDLGDPTATAHLAALLSDPVHQVAHNAAVSLVRLGESGLAVLRGAAEHDGAAGGHAREALALDELDAVRLAESGVAPQPERTAW